MSFNQWYKTIINSVHSVGPFKVFIHVIRNLCFLNLKLIVVLSRRLMNHITRHCCIRAHSRFVAECGGELATEAGGPFRSSTPHWPTLWWWFTWHQQTRQKLVSTFMTPCLFLRLWIMFLLIFSDLHFAPNLFPVHACTASSSNPLLSFCPSGTPWVSLSLNVTVYWRSVPCSER